MTEQKEVSSLLKVLIADDHTIFREGVHSLLEAGGKIQVVGEAGDGAEAVAKTRELNPDVVVMDIGMPEMNGLEASRLITQQSPQVRVVILTMHSSDKYFFEALRAGASGYVLKSAAFTDLEIALEAVRRGGVFLYSSLARKLVQDYLERTSGGERSTRDNLSPRERQILRLIGAGYTSQEIADRLVISINTVQTHRTHIMEKLNLHSRAKLMRYAIRMGLVTQPDLQ